MNSRVPDILYKYRSFNTRSLEMLRNNQVYFANPIEFNDPFDCSAQEYMHDNFRNDMAKISAARELNIEPMMLTDEQVQIFRIKVDKYLGPIKLSDAQGALDELRDNLGILSFSAINDSILMWSHYADMHKGFCIGFSIRNFGIPLKEFREVTYSRDRNLNLAFNLISNPNITADMFAEEFLKEYILTKYIDWQYEKEWRLIGCPKTFSPYANESIDRITFGLKMPPENRKQIRSILDGKNITFFEAVKSSKSFGLEIRQLD